MLRSIALKKLLLILIHTAQKLCEHFKILEEVQILTKKTQLL
jgi:hypothetical protein